MKIPLSLIKELRNMTSASISDCKKVLEEAKGDIQKAIELLRRRGLQIAAERQGLKAEGSPKEGRIEAYVHFNHKLGVLLEVGCDTDFVVRNNEFAQFAKDVAMHIAACNPLYLRKEEVPSEVIDREKDKEQFYKNNCLLEQAFVKDPNITIKDYLASMIAKVKENIVIRRFTRYKVGES